MSNNTILNRFFTQSIFQELINQNKNSLFDTCVRKYLTIGNYNHYNDLISGMYEYLNKQYRNEYFYKNTLLNKLLLGRHSINTTTALTEIPISKAKADFILINGKAVVYEIKTELDTFDRLESQINAYYKAFNHVCVVTSESQYDRVNRLLDKTNVGICVLTKRNTISTRKEPIEDNSQLDHTIMFKILRKQEYETILFDYYGDLPNTVPVKYFKECLDMFSNIDINVAYKYFINTLKNRSKLEKDEYEKVPYELKFLMYFSNYNKNDYAKLFSVLNKNWED